MAKRGPAARFDPETRERRRRELNYRKRLLAGEIMAYLEVRHPKIFRAAKAHAEATVINPRGPLPGDAPTNGEP